MKKNIRKVILDNITVISAIGVVCGIITLVLAALCMNGSDLIVGVVAAAAVTIIGSAVAAAWASKKLNAAISDSLEKLSAGEAVTGDDVPEEIVKASEAICGGVFDKSAELEFIAKLAEGDFSAQLPDALKNTETGKSLQTLADSLSRRFGAICRSAEQLSKEGTQVSGAFAALSADTGAQASALQQLSESVDSIRGTVDATAENAHKADKIATFATAEIEAGNVHMKDLLAAMDNISKSTDEITKFVKVIEDIAFQTNILALNSSVEAARAGGAGKGFAVVAGEVKTLATKSQEAAKQTTAVIEECVRNVREGVAKTDQTAKSLAAIAEETREVSRLVGVISDSCDEQRSVIGKIDEGVDFIGVAAKRTDSAAQACAASAQTLTSGSSALKAEIDAMRIGSVTKAAPVQKPVVRTAPAVEKPTPKAAEKPAVKATEKPAVKETEKPAVKEAVKPAAKPVAEKPAPKAAAPVAKTAPAPRSSVKNVSYANAEFVETPDSKY